MINPVIFSFNIGSFVFALRWYGVLVMTGLLLLAYRYGKLKLPLPKLPEKYQVSEKA